MDLIGPPYTRAGKNAGATWRTFIPTGPSSTGPDEIEDLDEPVTVRMPSPHHAFMAIPRKARPLTLSAEIVGDLVRELFTRAKTRDVTPLLEELCMLFGSLGQHERAAGRDLERAHDVAVTICSAYEAWGDAGSSKDEPELAPEDEAPGGRPQARISLPIAAVKAEVGMVSASKLREDRRALLITAANESDVASKGRRLLSISRRFREMQSRIVRERNPDHFPRAGMYQVVHGRLTRGDVDVVERDAGSDLGRRRPWIEGIVRRVVDEYRLAAPDRGENARRKESAFDDEHHVGPKRRNRRHEGTDEDPPGERQHAGHSASAAPYPRAGRLGCKRGLVDEPVWIIQPTQGALEASADMMGSSVTHQQDVGATHCASRRVPIARAP